MVSCGLGFRCLGVSTPCAVPAQRLRRARTAPGLYGVDWVTRRGSIRGPQGVPHFRKVCQKMLSRIFNTGGAVVTVAVLGVLGAQPSSAATLFQPTWGAGSFHASADYVPSAGTLKVGTLCSVGGPANYSYAAIVKTSSGQVNVTMPSYPCDGAWHNSSTYSTSTSGGVAYYLRWYGQSTSGTDGASADSAGARMWR